MDSYIRAYIKTYVHIDAGSRAFCKGEELPVHIIGGTRKVLLPISKILYTFDELKRVGAKVDVITLASLAKQGATGRWKENIEERSDRGLPSNVYVANARSVEYALSKGQVPPKAAYVGRRGREITEVRATVDEVVDDMANDRWRTDFARGGRAKRSKK